MKTMLRISAITMLALLFSALAACGGGGGAPAPASSTCIWDSSTWDNCNWSG